jgi:hypothetical protein
MQGAFNQFEPSAIAQGKIISLLHSEFTVQVESGMLYTFKAIDNFIYFDALYPHICFIPFISKEDIYQRNDAIEMAKMLSDFMSSGFSLLNLSKEVSDDIRFAYNYIFRTQEQPLVWKSKKNAADSYRASERTAAFLTTYSIDKVNDNWMVCASCAANGNETYHAREYEFSSTEPTLEAAKKQASVFQQMISSCVKEDLRYT